MRYLKSNHGSEVPQSLFFVDTETNSVGKGQKLSSWREKLRLGVVSHVRLRQGKIVHRSEATFFEPWQLWSFITERQQAKKSSWVFAHNMFFDFTISSGFDLLETGELCLDEKRAIFPVRKPGELVKRPWRGFAIVDGSPFIIRCKSRKGTLTFCDTFNYFKNSLAEIGEEIGVPKMPLPMAECADFEWIDYCRNDVQIIEKLMVELILYWQAEKLGNWAYTATGLAYNNFRHSHCPKRKTAKGKQVCSILIHEDKEAKKLERAAYHGGQVISYYLGSVGSHPWRVDWQPDHYAVLRHIDCNGLYPWAMAEYRYPTKYLGIRENIPLAGFDRWLDKKVFCAEVLVNSPIIPYLVKKDDKIQYAVGEFVTHLIGQELKQAYFAGHIKEIRKAAAYDSDYIFRDFVSFWFSQREQFANSGLLTKRKFAKTVINSLSGKFGQRSARWIDCPDIIPQESWQAWHHWDIQSKALIKYRAFAGLVQRQDESIDHRNSFCAISACIAANGRARMKYIMSLLPWRSIYYHHTDSLIINENAFNYLESLGHIGKGLGRFKQVDKPFDCALFYGPNDYIADGRIVLGGRKKNAVNLDKDTFEQDEFGGINDLVLGGGGNEVLIRRIQHKRNHNLVNAVDRSASGWVSPMHL